MKSLSKIVCAVSIGLLASCAHGAGEKTYPNLSPSAPVEELPVAVAVAAAAPAVAAPQVPLSTNDTASKRLANARHNLGKVPTLIRNAAGELGNAAAAYKDVAIGIPAIFTASYLLFGGESKITDKYVANVRASWSKWDNKEYTDAEIRSHVRSNRRFLATVCASGITSLAGILYANLSERKFS
jgi:hypothetical protein